VDDARGGTPGCGTLAGMSMPVVALAAALLVPAPEPPPAGAEVRAALAVLHRWDAERSAAYTSADGRRLEALYAPGSSAGAADVRLLAGYAAHGWRITAVTTQVRSVRVLAHTADRWLLRTTDRVRGLADAPQRCRPLPAGGYRTHNLELVRSGAVWVMASVRPAPSRGSR
jgi:hypothetical protein